MWTADEDALLGTMPDKDVAATIGRTRRAVAQRRSGKRIPPSAECRTRARRRTPDDLAPLWAEIQALDPTLETPEDAARFAAKLAIEHLRPRTIGFSLDEPTRQALDAAPNRSEAVRESVDATWAAFEAGDVLPAYEADAGPRTPIGVRVDGRTLRRLEGIAERIGLPRNRSAAICYAVMRPGLKIT